MKPDNKPRILTINGGSSSIKFAVFEVDGSLEQILHGEIERIGLSGTTLKVKGLSEADNFSKPVVALDHSVAVGILLDWIEERFTSDALTAIGYRVVHGGPKYSKPERITTELILELHSLSAFDLARTEGLDAKAFNEMVNFHSGLLGISETSSDMQDLLDLETKDARAAEAVSIFCYQVKKWIGAFAAALGGLDTLVFAGGIGENAPEVRARICDELQFLGSNLNKSKIIQVLLLSPEPVAQSLYVSCTQTNN